MIGEQVDGCRVSWHEAWGKQGKRRDLLSVAVRHVGKNVVEFTRPRTGQLVRKRLTGTKLEIQTSDGRDLVAAWRAA